MARSARSVGAGADLESIGLGELPMPGWLGPAVLAPREGMWIMSRVIDYGDEHGAWGGGVAASALQTLLPGHQAGPREQVGFVARGYDHSNTPGLMGGLLLDFGPAGTLLCVFLLGWALGHAHARATRDGGGAVLYGVLLAVVLSSLHAGLLDASVLIVVACLWTLLTFGAHADAGRLLPWPAKTSA